MTDEKQLDATDHWEALFNREYLRWFHLNNQSALVKITKVRKNVPLVLPGGKKTKAGVIEIEQLNGKIEEVKPLVLNKTNAGEIAKIHGQRPSQWVGCEIVLVPTTTQLKGEEVGCIRVRAKREQK